jgi:hypothetical protein
LINRDKTLVELLTCSGLLQDVFTLLQMCMSSLPIS